MGYEEGELELEEGEAASGGGRELVIPDALTCIVRTFSALLLVLLVVLLRVRVYWING